MHSQNAFDTSTYQICKKLRDNNETPNFIMLQYNSRYFINNHDYMAMADSVWYENVTEYCLETHLVSYVFVML